MIDSIFKKIFMINHTHIFDLGTLWDEFQLPRLIVKKFDINKLNKFNFNNNIESIKIDEEFNNELNKFVKKVKNIMKNIPNDWNISDKEKNLLIDYVYNRFNRVDEILDLLNIKGGDNSEI